MPVRFKYMLNVNVIDIRFQQKILLSKNMYRISKTVQNRNLINHKSFLFIKRRTHLNKEGR